MTSPIKLRNQPLYRQLIGLLVGLSLAIPAIARPSSLGRLHSGPRPDVLFHGADSFQLDEVDLILILLGQRQVAILSNYGVSWLTHGGTDVSARKERLDTLRALTPKHPAIRATNRLVRQLGRKGHLDYALLYSTDDSVPAHPYPSGESYPPWPRAQVHELPAGPRPRLIAAEPNGLTYAIANYPRFYRFCVYSSEDLPIAQLFGEYIFVLKDRAQRGVGLPSLAVGSNGSDALLNERTHGYNPATNADEYVWPGYILATEVQAIHVQDPFRKRQFGNEVVRTYERSDGSPHPIVTLKRADGRVLLQAGWTSRGIQYRLVDHPDRKSGRAPVAEEIAQQIDAWNEDWSDSQQ